MNKTKTPPDYFLFSVVLIMLGLGLVAIYSSSAVYAMDKYNSPAYFFWKQLTWIGLGTVAGLFLVLVDHRKLRAWIKPMLAACFAMLIAVLVWGREVSGAKRWLRFAGIGFQPSEAVKIALILFVADYCDRKRSRMNSFKQGLLPVLIVIGLFCGLILLQPDLGTPVLIASACLVVIFLGGAEWKHLAGLGLAGALFTFGAVWLKPYRRRRLMTFLDPWNDVSGEGYQLVQSLLAIGSGGIAGVGLGSSHSKLLYLPEPHTDFIFPIFSEEVGLAGSLILLSLFGLVAWRGFRISHRASSVFSSLLSSGITVMILLQALFNIAVVTGCLPTKGLPLPFISFGGSSLVITLAAVGILLNISRTMKTGTAQ